MRFLLLAFIVVPLVEMMLLFEVSDQIGGFTTLLLVVLTAVVGIQILKQQGFSTLLRANARLESGEIPAQEIIEGMMLAAAGALLLTPGFITDGIGFILLAGPLRRPLARKAIKAGIITAVGSKGGRQTWRHTGSRDDSGNVYEGEYSRPDSAKIDQKGPDSGER